MEDDHQLNITLIVTKLVTHGIQKLAHGLHKMSVLLDVKQRTPGLPQEGRDHTLLVAMAGILAMVVRDGKIQKHLTF